MRKSVSFLRRDRDYIQVWLRLYHLLPYSKTGYNAAHPLPISLPHRAIRGKRMESGPRLGLEEDHTHGWMDGLAMSFHPSIVMILDPSKAMVLFPTLSQVQARAQGQCPSPSPSLRSKPEPKLKPKAQGPNSNPRPKVQAPARSPRSNLKHKAQDPSSSPKPKIQAQT